MRKLILSAVIAGALAVPSGASAQTCVTPVVPCVMERVHELTYCVIHDCWPAVDLDPICRMIWGEECSLGRE